MTNFKWLKQKCIRILITAVLTIVFCVQANAQSTHDNLENSDIPVQLRWTHISVINVYLLFNNGKGTLSASVIGQPGTTRITGNAVLERINPDGTVASWLNLSANGDSLDWGQTYYVTRGFTYRLKFTATVYRNGTSETASNSITAYAS